MCLPAVVDDRDLYTTFLPPFLGCAKDGGALLTMCSYNGFNGVPMCANGRMLQDVLKCATVAARGGGAHGRHQQPRQ